MAIRQPVLLAELVMSIQRLISDAENAPTVEGEWPPVVVLGHLSQVDEQVWLARINQMVSAYDQEEKAPEFEWWEPDAVETFEKYKGDSIEKVSAELISSRTRLLARLRELSQPQWGAQAVHSTFGVIDISGLLIELLRHDEEHRASLVLK
jgi:hypothetical protein